ncbi:MAG: hypothetical protein ACTHN5_23605, partial [Phycisphaerae bacterium]
FNSLPPKLHPLSFYATHFADPAFSLHETATPYILFDNNANTAVLSPASNFLIARMHGTLEMGGSLASDLNLNLHNLPANFSHQTLLTLGSGIQNTLLAWGNALSAHLHAPRPTNEADPLLRYLGYWTDNGAFYYYNYDLQKGYTPTLEALADHYRDKHIPLHYLQLDSWWYPKSLTDFKGKRGQTKNPRLPESSWNRYGGTLEYTAHPDLFPHGLAAWQKQLDLPLVVHARWIDLDSPYHAKYKISGVAPTDPKFWNDIATYLQSAGVICYEQDWLNFIYDYSPELQSTPDAANQFADNMAKACQSHGLSIQYCMAPARFFLQSAKYPNVTTLRVSDDRFEPKKYNNFLYTSLLAHAVGKWPWVDVFRSTEPDNLLLATLSAGPVGIGDEIGKENRDNLLHAVRPDGVIVKPDAPILPTDASILADASNKHQPLLATTYTAHDAGKTLYAFAYPRESDAHTVSFTPKSLGATTPVYLYEPATHTATLLQPADTFTASLPEKSAAFYQLFPVQKNGIAFAGDENLFVSTGQQRLSELKADDHLLLASLVAAPGESAITLHGFADNPPQIALTGATADPIAFDPKNHHFQFTIHPNESAPLDRFSADPVHRIELRLTAK